MSWVKIACWQCKGTVIPDQDYLARDIPLTPRRNILESFKTRLRRIMSKSKVKTNKVSGTNYRHDAQRVHGFVKFTGFMMRFRDKCLQIFCLFGGFWAQFSSIGPKKKKISSTEKTNTLPPRFYSNHIHTMLRGRTTSPSGLIVAKNNLQGSQSQRWSHFIQKRNNKKEKKTKSSGRFFFQLHQPNVWKQKQKQARTMRRHSRHAEPEA